MDAATAERGPPRVNRWEGDFYRTAIGAYGRILASLIRMVWDITLAEDALADGKRDEIATKIFPPRPLCRCGGEQAAGQANCLAGVWRPICTMLLVPGANCGHEA